MKNAANDVPEALNGKPEWTAQTIALDPYAAAQSVAWRSGRRDIEARLADGSVTVRRELECGVPLKLRMAAKQFEGVAARAFENEDGSCTVTLELLHADQALSVPLLVSDDPEGAARDWRSWARNLRLPMVIASAEGHVVVGEDAPSPAPRRRRHTVSRNRPSFLRRRKAGRVGTVERLAAREIIARN